MKEFIYTRATEQARAQNQTVGAKGDYYITLQQLERILANI